MQNVANLNPAKEKRTRNPASPVCPKCSSDDMRSFETVNSEGTLSGTFAAGSNTFGGATPTKGQTSSQSVVAAKTQPPEEPSAEMLGVE